MEQAAPTLVFAPDRGVGDLMWHLPTVRGIAEQAGAPVVLITRPSTRAKELLSAEPSVSEIVYVINHKGTWRRLAEARELYRLCRQYRPRALWTLEKTWPGPLGAFLAGVPERPGFGLGHEQAWVLTGPKLPRAMQPDHRIAKLAAFETAHGLPVVSREPLLPLPRTGADAIAAFADLPRPWVVFGVGTTDPDRLWPLDRFAALAQALKSRLGGTVFWLGDPERAEAVAALLKPGQIDVSAFKLDAAAHLISAADIFIGVDSGPMNMAASLRRPTIGLFGPSQALDYSQWLTAITPETPSDGMKGVAVEAVLAAALRLIGDEALARPAEPR